MLAYGYFLINHPLHIPMRTTFFALGLTHLAIFVSILSMADNAWIKVLCFMGLLCVIYAYISYSAHVRLNPAPELIPLAERRNDRETRLEMIHVAYECASRTYSALTLHTLTHVLDSCEDKLARLDKFNSFCAQAKGHHAHLVGVVAAFFPEHIELAQSMASDISNIQGHFNNHIHAGAPEIKDFNNSYVITREHLSKLEDKVEKLCTALLRISEQLNSQPATKP